MPNIQHAHLVVVTDCGGSDESRYGIAADRCFFPVQPQVSFFPTASMNTLHTGFTAAAHALSTVQHFGPLQSGERIGLLVNAAPRGGAEDDQSLRGEDRNVEGEEIYALRLTSGVWVVGPNAGMNFAFIPDHQIEESYLLTDTSGLETPFRSMEFMIPALADVLGVKELATLEKTPKDLPRLPVKEGVFVADWDIHGNMYVLSTVPEKTWVPQLGNHLTVNIGNNISRLRHVDGIFAGETGEVTLTTGSLKLNGRHVYYIVVVGGDAHGLFKNPPVGTRIHIT